MEDKICPKCGTILIETPWFDDPTEVGGACIGTLLDCPNCGWHDSL